MSVVIEPVAACSWDGIGLLLDGGRQKRLELGIQRFKAPGHVPVVGLPELARKTQEETAEDPDKQDERNDGGKTDARGHLERHRGERHRTQHEPQTDEPPVQALDPEAARNRFQLPTKCGFNHDKVLQG